MSNWREVRAKRPPREDRVALHRAHLDEVEEETMIVETIWIDNVRHTGTSCPSCDTQLLRCTIDNGCCEECVEDGPIAHHRRVVSPLG